MKTSRENIKENNTTKGDSSARTKQVAGRPKTN
jgi:hypothetical protein